MCVGSELFNENNRIQLISTSNSANHALILTQMGKLYGVGNSETGRIGASKVYYGNESKKEYVLQIKILPFKSEIIDIKCGESHTLFLSNGMVYASGDNKYGNLGQNDNSKLKGLNYSNIILKVESKYFNNEYITKIGCTVSTSFCVSKAGNVYSWGSNANKICGNKDDMDIYLSPKMIQYFMDNNIHISDIQCGYDHIIVINKIGVCFSWGKHDNGQCGVALQSEYISDIKTINIDINSIHVGYDHNILINTDNDLYLFGNDSHHELFNTNSNLKKYYIPVSLTNKQLLTKIKKNNPTFIGNKIYDIICAKYCTFIVA